MPVTVLLPKQHPGYVAGRWYFSTSALVIAGAAIPANSIRLQPFVLDEPITLAGLACRVATASAGGNIALAVYAADPTTHLPTGTALATSGNLATDAATIVSANLGANVELDRGLYWMAVISDNAVAACQTLNGSLTNASELIGSTTIANLTPATTGANMILTYAHTFGTWPDLNAVSFTEVASSASALIYLKAA